jgi:hypothetical protein
MHACLMAVLDGVELLPSCSGLCTLGDAHSVLIVKGYNR